MAGTALEGIAAINSAANTAHNFSRSFMAASRVTRAIFRESSGNLSIWIQVLHLSPIQQIYWRPHLLLPAPNEQIR
jgi:hypothetical protein